MSLNNSKGSFSIVYSGNSVSDFAPWYDLTQCVLERCVVVRAELMPMTNTVDYDAFSPYFDEVKGGELIPEYVAVIKQDEDGHPEFIKFERK